MKGPSRAARVRDRIEQLQLLTGFEKRLQKSLKPLLSKQYKTLAEQYRTEHNVSAQKLVSQNVALKAVLTLNYKRTTDAFASRIRKIHRKADFTTAILDWITNRALSTITNINDTTLSNIQQIIHDGISNGLTTSDIANQIEDASDETDIRSMTIARTETHTAANYAGLEAAKDTGVATYKTWTASLDNRTRDAHSEADGQTVEVDDTFTVDGEDVDHPGDGSPENAVNCRCCLIYSTGSTDESDDDD